MSGGPAAPQACDLLCSLVTSPVGNIQEWRFIMVRTARRGRVEPEVGSELIDQIRQSSRPLRGPRDLGPLMERIGDARFVLLGEASHGTAEYYTWRAEIT